MRILARTHQQLVWDRNRQTNRLRNALREYFPAALEAFPEHAHGDAVGVLSTAPGPREAARLSVSQIPSALRRGGRQRSIERRAAEVRDALRSPQLEAPAAVSKAFATSTRAAVGLINEINRQIKEPEFLVGDDPLQPDVPTSGVATGRPSVNSSRKATFTNSGAPTM